MKIKLFGRKLLLTAGDKEFNGDDFTIEFKVPFSTSKEPDISEIDIYNLSKQSISAIKNKAYTILNVGYEGDIGSILIGKIVSVETKWSGLDKITTIKVSDGGVEFKNATIQKTYQAGTKASYIMQDLSSLLGLEVVEVKPRTDITYKRGKTISGNINKALKVLVADTKSKMYVNKGKLYIRESGKGTETGFVLNSSTGLIDSPEMIEEEVDKKKVIKYNVKCLLNHKITTDSIIKIESKTVNGFFRVESGEHGGDFITNIKVVAR